MQSLFRAAAIAALALPLAFTPVLAQDYQGALTLYGGGIWFSDMNENGDFELLEDEPEFEPATDLTLDEGWVAGTQLELWPGALNGRFGLRANAGYTERQFKLEDIGTTETDVAFGDVNTWLFNGDILTRILTPGRTRVWAPYIALGAGVVHYNPAGEGTEVTQANALFEDSETEFAINFGLGADVLPGWNLGNMGVGIRMEVMDHYTLDSPAEPFRVIDGDIVAGDEYDGVHNVRFTAGTVLTFGRMFAEERVAVAPPPTPPAPPAPPEPEEEMITVCVIDPTVAGAVHEVDAIYLPETRDTVVVRNGDRVAFETAHPTTPPLYAGEAGWFVRGEPMTVSVADREMEFVSFGGTRIIEPNELTWIGNYRGTPVFASARDLSGVRTDLDRALERDEDLEDVLEDDDLRTAIGELDALYVPTETGCVFQPFRMVEDVRKVRG